MVALLNPDKPCSIWNEKDAEKYFDFTSEIISW